MDTPAERSHIVDNLAAVYGAVTAAEQTTFTVDVLTDLLRWSDRHGVSFDGALTLARANVVADANADCPLP